MKRRRSVSTKQHEPFAKRQRTQLEKSKSVPLQLEKKHSITSGKFMLKHCPKSVSPSATYTKPTDTIISLKFSLKSLEYQINKLKDKSESPEFSLTYFEQMQLQNISDISDIESSINIYEPSADDRRSNETNSDAYTSSSS